MINFVVSIYIIKIFIKTKKLKILNLNNFITLFYAKYFSRNIIVDSGCLDLIYRFVILNKKRNKNNLFYIQYNKLLRYSKKDLIYLSLLIKNFCKLFVSLASNNLNNYENITKNKKKLLIKKICSKKIYCIRNMLHSSSINFRNIEKIHKNRKKFIEMKGLLKNDQNLLNFSIYFTKLNIMLKKYNLKGFTKNAFEILANILDLHSKQLILTVSKITVQKQKKSYSRLEQWGRKNIYVPNKKFSNFNLKIEKVISTEKSVLKQISCFRKVKKSLLLKKKRWF